MAEMRQYVIVSTMSLILAVPPQLRSQSAKGQSTQPDDPVGARGQSAKSIALRGIARLLVNLVADGVVKPFRHVAPNKLDRCHASDLVRVRLPERAMQ